MNPEHELRTLFRGLVEHVFFTDVGICVPALTDYLSGMLVAFLRVDHVFPPRVLAGDELRAIALQQAGAGLAADADEHARARVIHRYIGDVTLFWTGLYPEMLRPRRQGGVDRFLEYTLEGKRGYGIASDLSRADDAPPAALLHDLSEQFDCCRHGLYLVRQSWADLTRQPRQN